MKKIMFVLLCVSLKTQALYKDIFVAGAARVADVGNVLIKGVREINKNTQLVNRGQEAAVAVGLFGLISLFFAGKEVASKSVALASIGALGVLCFAGKGYFTDSAVSR